MSIFFTILILMLIVSLSSLITRWIPFQIPLPLIQVVIGVILAWFNILNVTLYPELFMALFIPPLLFYDGRQTVLLKLWESKKEIASLALFLVFFTTIIVGYLLHLLIPSISLAAGFALGAIISPTDTVALMGIIGKGKICNAKMKVLEQESLMNDASGLVTFKFALAIIMGVMSFDMVNLTLSFLKVVIGGLLCGFILVWAYSKLLNALKRWSDADPASQIILLLLLPFAAYLIADSLELSGVLATISAGVTMNYLNVMAHAPLSSRTLSNSLWTMLNYTFNGMVFLLLGLQLPGIINNTWFELQHDNLIANWQLPVYTALIFVVLLLIRYGWFYGMHKIAKLPWFNKKQSTFSTYTQRDMWTASIAGVRGAITLAGVLSIPLIINNDPYAGRYILVSIASGVIVLSLFCAVFVLPFLLPGNILIDKKADMLQEKFAREMMVEQSLERLEHLDTFLHHQDDTVIDEEIFTTVLSRIKNQLEYQQRKEIPVHINEQTEKLEKRMQLVILSAQRDTLQQLYKKNKINQPVYDKLMYNLDLYETIVMNKH